MENTLAVFLLLSPIIISGCGGNPVPVSFTAADVFTNRAETWTFQNGYGDISTVEVIPRDATHSTWHYTKTADRAYWAADIPQAEIFFDLELSNGAWYSTGGQISFPQGCPWCLAGYVNQPYSVVTKAGQPRPYLILPATSGFSYQAIFDDSYPDAPNHTETTADVLWKTSSYVEEVDTPIYSGPAFVTDQWEGPCVHEKWYLAPGLGMVKILPLDRGDCKGENPAIAMARIH